jgi:hypothetical protein
LVTAGCAAVIVAGLFVAYLRISSTGAENSDEANILLQASDMLHGNLLLSGWMLSDVSFYTTELPQYALLEHVFGLRLETAHIGAAMTYTIVVLLAAVLAAGRRARVPATERTMRAVLAAGIMIAPQLGVGVFILLLSVGHIGSAVPLMLTWLVIDRRPECTAGGWREWLVPFAVAVLLTWSLIADPLILVAGIVPLTAVCLLRAGLAFAAPPGLAFAAPSRFTSRAWLLAGLRAGQRNLALAVAAVAAYGLAAAVEWLLRLSGAFDVLKVAYRFAPPSQWPEHAWITAQGWLALFGAKPGGSGVQTAFALLHLIGVALVLVAMYQVARRFLRDAELIDQVLLVAIVLNVALYIPTTLASASVLNAREFAVALPFGAVLAGRRVAVPILASVRSGRGSRWTRGIAVTVLAGYLAGLGYAAAQPAVPPENQRLADWLAAHRLTYGIGGYWQASSVTLASNLRVTIRAVMPRMLLRYLWECKFAWYNPHENTATFLVTDSGQGFNGNWIPNPAAVVGYGQPARIYHVGTYTVYVWPHENLLHGPRYYQMRQLGMSSADPTARLSISLVIALPLASSRRPGRRWPPSVR